jgi:acyl dehydratase
MASTDMLSADSEGKRYDEPLVGDRFIPNEIDLFMFCAATWNTHRIHYDREYARAEGYRDLVVPGPLQVARLGQMLADFAAVHDGRLESMSVRHHASLYCNEPVDLRADLVAVRSVADGSVIELAVVVADPEGMPATSGTAALALPRTPPADAFLRSLRSGVV